MKGPRIYKSIHAIMGELTRVGIPKSHTNAQDHYQYRSIDDVLSVLAPLLAKHRLCILPRVLERTAVDRVGSAGEPLVSVALRVAFDLISAVDQSQHSVEAYGEAFDGGDKATAKAMSSAYKTAILQTFCVPVAGSEEPDAQTYRLRKNDHLPPPVQGWQQWTADIIDIIGACDSDEGLTRVQDSNRALLKAISRERSDLYTTIGEAFRSRKTGLEARSKSCRAKPSANKSSRGSLPDQALPSKLEPAHA